MDQNVGSEVALNNSTRVHLKVPGLQRARALMSARQSFEYTVHAFGGKCLRYNAGLTSYLPE